MPDFNRGLVLTYSKVYGNAKELTDESLSSLDKNTWAKVLARLNYLARKEKGYQILDVLNDWFGKENKLYSNELFRKIALAYQALNVRPADLVTINIWSNMTLLDFILRAAVNDDHKLNDIDSEKELFDIYIATNEILGKKTDGIFQSVSDEMFPDTNDKLARVYLTNVLPYHDLNHFRPLDLFVSGFIKSYYLFKFLEIDHQKLIDLFLIPYGVDHWKKYLKNIIPLTMHSTNEGDGSGLNYLSLKDSKEKEQGKVFLDHLSLVDDVNYEIKTDFLHARANPLFKIDDDTYLIIDSVLVVNRIYNSLFFELLRLAERNKKLHTAYKEFFSFYTYEFIEKYLSYSLLEKIFGKTKYYKISGANIVSKYHIDTEPDIMFETEIKFFFSK